MSGVYGLGRAKAVDSASAAAAAAAAAAATAEFSMQTEDFPALGAMSGKPSDSIFGQHTSPPQPHQSLQQQQQHQELQQAQIQSQQNLSHLGAQQQHALLRSNLTGFSPAPAPLIPLYANGTSTPPTSRISLPPQLPPNGRRAGGPPGAAMLLNGTTPGAYPLVQHSMQKTLTQPQPAGWSPGLPPLDKSQQDGLNAAATSSSPPPASTHSLFEMSVPVSPKSASMAHQSSLQESGTDLTSPASGAAADIASINSGRSTPQPVSTDGSGNGTDGAARLADGELVEEPTDRFGMKGLLRVLKPGSDSTDLFLLSIGLDLTMLGLNLNSPDPLHLTFESPWDENQSAPTSITSGPGVQGRGGEPHHKLPECYYMQPPALKTSHFAKFQLETLFYVFYNMPGDVLQLLAAVELNNRDWRYHKDLKLWFTRAPGTVPSYENGSYIYFDISNWERQPFHDGANVTFVKGLMTEDELRGARIPMSSMHPASS
jgi:NOT2 / NOT3 / NOT5 family